MSDVVEDKSKDQLINEEIDKLVLTAKQKTPAGGDVGDFMVAFFTDFSRNHSIPTDLFEYISRIARKQGFILALRWDGKRMNSVELEELIETSGFRHDCSLKDATRRFHQPILGVDNSGVFQHGDTSFMAMYDYIKRRRESWNLRHFHYQEDYEHISNRSFWDILRYLPSEKVRNRVIEDTYKRSLKVLRIYDTLMARCLFIDSMGGNKTDSLNNLAMELHKIELIVMNVGGINEPIPDAIKNMLNADVSEDKEFNEIL